MEVPGVSVVEAERDLVDTVGMLHHLVEPRLTTHTHTDTQVITWIIYKRMFDI